MIKIKTPISVEDIQGLKVGDMIEISGHIFTGRDAVLPKVVSLIKEEELGKYGIDLEGSIIFHTAVSPAGVGPTSSNKYDIETSIPSLSKAGVRIHLGKGGLSVETKRALEENNSLYAVIPPVTALLQSKLIKQEVKAFPEEGMEAFHLLEVKDFPAIVAIAHGKSIY
ncbi:fumarate hydratase C-terminal domain-containing protein [uncultured Clostridium sp.]|uniref:fumarate hydratase C-terminal domain-containing protein n=1 Tax=uncultured Clostridium sp. TaxID=59620 RepID=UPI0028E9E569|nr:fumarate hydratase C-terminal domain-containing protein [uncultured Clostridium sp.]